MNKFEPDKGKQVALCFDQCTHSLSASNQNLWQSISAKLNVERTQGSGDPAAQTGRYCSPRLGLSRCPSPNKTQNVIGSFIQSQVISLTNIQQAKHGFA